MKPVIARSCEMNGSHFGKIVVAVPVNCGRVVDVDLSPGVDHDLVAGSEHVVCGDGNVVDRRERRWRLTKKAVAVHAQPLPERSRDVMLELGVGLRSNAATLLGDGGFLRHARLPSANAVG